jgi:uncharacterized protein YfbU (UPF0304 family)
VFRETKRNVLSNQYIIMNNINGNTTRYNLLTDKHKLA